jgi:uncharacterized membrane protein
MRWIIAFLAVIGIVVSSLALREHYRTDASPCSINEKWDCGIVNKSPYALIGGVPVAIIGIAGYLLIAGLALRRAYKLLLVAVLGAVAFSLYLTNIEAHVLEVWCIYCVCSLATVSAITLLTIGVNVAGFMQKPKAA